MTENGIEKLKYNYEYDGTNRRSVTKYVNGVFDTWDVYTCNKANRIMQCLLFTEDGMNTRSYVYDANGNLTRQALYYASLEKDEHFTYDVLGRQTGYTDGTVTAAYSYDADGLRTSKTVNGVTTEYVTDGGRVVLELVNGTVTARYLYGLGLVHAAIGADSYYYSCNGHGDVVQLTDASGNVVRSYEYDAFGNELNPTAGDNNPFRYCGEYFDIETGSYYLRARYYNPHSGRFLTEDPIRDGLNWYAYCGSNPVAFIDPLGLMDVLARDYLEARGAEVIWTGNETRDGSVYANATVNYNGNSYNLTGTLVDGRMVMDDAEINGIFGWSKTVYYFYGTDQATHAANNIADLRNNNYAVIGTLFTNKRDFKNAYNAMPATVDIVIIHQHGNPTLVRDVKPLYLDMTKSIDTFVLLSCNAGHLWTGADSIALQIAKASRGNIRQLIAADGTHYRPLPMQIEVIGDALWAKLIDSSLADRASSQGFIRYKWNGTAYNRDSVGKSFDSVRSLLKRVGAQ